MDRRRRLLLQVLDTLGYAVAITTVVFLLGAAIAALAGRQPLVGAKWFMFYVGFLLLAYSAFKLRPTALWKQDEQGTRNGIRADGPVGLQAVVVGAIPEDYQLPLEHRHSTGTKLFVASIVVLATSFLMETVFGIGYTV